MYYEIITTGSGIEAKGRNGYFKLAKIEVYGDAKENVYLHFSSASSRPPMTIIGNKEAVVEMLLHIVDAIKEKLKEG